MHYKLMASFEDENVFYLWAQYSLETITAPHKGAEALVSGSSYISEEMNWGRFAPLPLVIAPAVNLSVCFRSYWSSHI